MKKNSLFLVLTLLLIAGLAGSVRADIKSSDISIGANFIGGGITGTTGVATVGFGVGDQMRIDVGVGSLSFASGYTSPVTIMGIFYYKMNPRAQNVMHVVADVGITFNYTVGNQVNAQSQTLFTIGGGIGWECFINRDFSVNADVMLAQVSFGGGGSLFSVLAPKLSAHYYL